MDDKVNHSQAEKILNAALETMYENKISGSRMRQIAKRAGMSQGNLHYYFPSKAELYLALLDHLLETFVEERRYKLANSELSPSEKMRVFLDQAKELIIRGKEIEVKFDFWVQANTDPSIHNKIRSMYQKWRGDIEHVVQEGIQKGEFSLKNASIVPFILVSIMEGAALQYLIDHQSFNLDTYFDTAYTSLLGLLQP